MVTDPIADLLTRIRNAMKAKHELVVVPYSTMKEKIVQILKEKEYVKDVKVEEKEHKNLIVSLIPGKEFKLQRRSRPGQRIYLGKDQVRKSYQGYGIGIYSTNKGIVTDKEARKAKTGGEFLCEIF